MSASIITTPLGRFERAAREEQAATYVATEARPATAKLRLTRRGRMVFGALATIAVGIALGVAALLGAPSASASDSVAENPGQFSYIVVQPGESLWSVATVLDPAADPRDVIADIVRLNQLGDSSVQAGQPIAVPMEYAQTPGVLSAEEVGLS